MNRIHLFSSFSEIDESLLYRSEVSVKTKSKDIWVKPLAIAICFLLVIGTSFLFLYTPSSNKNPQNAIPVTEQNSTSPLLSYFEKKNIPAELIERPVFSGAIDMPIVQKENILNSINNSAVVDGTINKIDTIKINENGYLWYITTIALKINEVIKGTANTEITIVCVAYSNITSENSISDPSIEGCFEGMNSVFVLSPISDASIKILGKDVYLSDLGDFSVSYRLDRNNDELVYPFRQNISILLDEIK